MGANLSGRVCCSYGGAFRDKGPQPIKLDHGKQNHYIVNVLIDAGSPRGQQFACQRLPALVVLMFFAPFRLL